jgi:signal transduction histidine kinase
MLTKDELKHLLKDSTIMFVDDDESIRDGMYGILRSFFKDVILAENGQMALDKYNEHNKSIDMIVTDISMPVMDGITFVRKLKEINEDQPVIVVSAHSDSEYFIKLIEAGVEGFILKPINPAEVLSKIGKTIESKYYKKKSAQQQAKLAAVGDMMENITHQWKQPLNVLEIKVGQIELDMMMGDLTDTILDSALSDIKNSVKFISQTIDDFRGFFDPNAKRKEFNISESIEAIYRVIKSSFKKESIVVITNFDNTISLVSFENALQQIVMNLMGNAKDVLIEKNPTSNRAMILDVLADEKNIYIKVTDNGGGIPEGIIDNIFDSHFTTKGKKGSGIGLNMSKQLAFDTLRGTLTVENVESPYGKGACFTLTIPKDDQLI